jgi:gamma-glutamylcyclotransferase (GGCT)/AIG2-like uncharacterized protein YtfP
LAAILCDLINWENAHSPRVCLSASRQQPYPFRQNVCSGKAIMVDDRDVWLFSYGTLRQSEVQIALFGRLLEEEQDSLPGFRIDTIEIAEPDIVNLSGKAIHLILRRGGEIGRDSVIGAVLQLREDELAAADDYEGDNYQRIEVTLGSGRRAFAYVAPEGP